MSCYNILINKSLNNARRLIPLPGSTSEAIELKYWAVTDPHGRAVIPSHHHRNYPSLRFADSLILADIQYHCEWLPTTCKLHARHPPNSSRRPDFIYPTGSSLTADQPTTTNYRSRLHQPSPSVKTNSQNQWRNQPTTQSIETSTLLIPGVLNPIIYFMSQYQNKLIDILLTVLWMIF